MPFCAVYWTSFLEMVFNFPFTVSNVLIMNKFFEQVVWIFE